MEPIDASGKHSEPTRRPPGMTALLVLASCFALDAARDYFLPIFLALIVYFILSPLVRALHRRLRLPPALGAAVVLLLLIGATVFAFSRLAEPASEWMAKAPRSLRSVERKLGQLRKPVEQVSQAAEQVENLTRMDRDDSVQEVEIKAQSLSGTLMIGTQKLVVGAAVVVILLYFFLVSGDRFLLELVRVSPLGRRQQAELVLSETERQVSAYLATVTLINLALGAAVAVALYFLGVPNPVLWGVLAAVLNFVPYFGALVGVVILGLISALTFDSLGAAVVPPAVYFGLTSLEGSFITPAVLGRRFALNPVVIILWLLLWGWMWGIAGALLAMPLLTVLRILSDHVDSLAPLRALLDR
jgi:predicted PurR-regulated permease PerM